MWILETDVIIKIATARRVPGPIWSSGGQVDVIKKQSTTKHFLIICLILYNLRKIVSGILLIGNEIQIPCQFLFHRSATIPSNIPHYCFPNSPKSYKSREKWQTNFHHDVITQDECFPYSSS